MILLQYSFGFYVSVQRNSLIAVYHVLHVHRGLEHGAGLVWLRQWMIDSA